MLELALRPFTTSWYDWKEGASVSADPDAGPVSEVRYYHEGVAVSHFSPAYARLTDNVPLPGAQTAVILGDSYVEALQVLDAETMGAVVERTARSSGSRLNVRQYGWSGASVSRYVDVAPEVLTRWKPSWVAVVLNKEDFVAEERALPCGNDVLLHAETGHSPVLVARSGLRHTVGVWERAVLRHSRLASEIDRRAREIGSSPSLDSTGTMTPCASVRALRAAYSSRLVVVYVASVNSRDDSKGDLVETALLRSCEIQNVTCLSTRARMVTELNAHNQFARGFSNTAPNSGHPNALGHRIIGEELWRTLSQQVSSELIAGGVN